MKTLTDLFTLLGHAIALVCQFIGDVFSLALGLVMPALLSGAAMAFGMAVTQFPAVRGIPELGRLVLGGTTLCVVVGIVSWAHLVHRWWPSSPHDVPASPDGEPVVGRG